MGRLRDRLNRIEAKATGTMTHADGFLLLARDILDEVKDGVNISIEMTDDGTFFDFAMGKIKRLPVRVVVDLLEGDEVEK